MNAGAGGRTSAGPSGVVNQPRGSSSAAAASACNPSGVRSSSGGRAPSTPSFLAGRAGGSPSSVAASVQSTSQQSGSSVRAGSTTSPSSPPVDSTNSQFDFTVLSTLLVLSPLVCCFGFDFERVFVVLLRRPRITGPDLHAQPVSVMTFQD